MLIVIIRITWWKQFFYVFRLRHQDLVRVMTLTDCLFFLFGSVFRLLVSPYNLGAQATMTMKTRTTSKNNCFYEQTCITLFSTFLWRPLMWRFMEDVNIWQQISRSLFLILDKLLTNSTPGNIAYIWQIEGFQIEAVKAARMQIHFFRDVFTTVVVIVGLSPC